MDLIFFRMPMTDSTRPALSGDLHGPTLSQGPSVSWSQANTTHPPGLPRPGRPVTLEARPQGPRIESVLSRVESAVYHVHHLVDDTRINVDFISRKMDLVLRNFESSVGFLTRYVCLMAYFLNLLL